MKLSLIAAACLALGLVACRDDSAAVPVITSKTPVVHSEHPRAIAIAHGVAIAIQPYMIHGEIEGSTALPVTEVRVDDPTMVEVIPASKTYDVREAQSPNGRAWILVGQKPGTTTLRLYRDSDEEGSMLVDVIAQVP
jgi:hypothetical protein